MNGYKTFFLCFALLVLLITPAFATIVYSGGDGTSQKSAIVIGNAVNENDGVESEYQWLASKFGAEDTYWNVTNQKTLSDAGRVYDVLNVKFHKGVPGHAAGSEAQFYFDITDFYGRFE